MPSNQIITEEEEFKNFVSSFFYLKKESEHIGLKNTSHALTHVIEACIMDFYQDSLSENDLKLFTKFICSLAKCPQNSFKEVLEQLEELQANPSSLNIQ